MAKKQPRFYLAGPSKFGLADPPEGDQPGSEWANQETVELAQAAYRAWKTGGEAGLERQLREGWG